MGPKNASSPQIFSLLCGLLRLTILPSMIPLVQGKYLHYHHLPYDHRRWDKRVLCRLHHVQIGSAPSLDKQKRKLHLW
ncbi:hypothetical protein ES319_D12G107700v1 [Gossypium barbadense]|uniref:Secreted protein n=3 Tax=Gossypium TaxID=3633 RepID=A0A5J5NX33_GOSBA|nr:hypothetical protein ES319_D12G107700v1 [Gossypium barbadense]TYG40693.1 hypothetical protein ES288_D12G113800v1 [Gossypium darwinii]TYH38508.1 hypothetical protein ES332_D12G114400v1 [Gossypium tomentosum]